LDIFIMEFFLLIDKRTDVPVLSGRRCTVLDGRNSAAVSSASGSARPGVQLKLVSSLPVS
jgi:hypothetical protein